MNSDIQSVSDIKYKTLDKQESMSTGNEKFENSKSVGGKSGGSKSDCPSQKMQNKMHSLSI